jgi:hypothetical protein
VFPAFSRSFGLKADRGNVANVTTRPLILFTISFESRYHYGCLKKYRNCTANRCIVAVCGRIKRLVMQLLRRQLKFRSIDLLLTILVVTILVNGIKKGGAGDAKAFVCDQLAGVRVFYFSGIGINCFGNGIEPCRAPDQGPRRNRTAGGRWRRRHIQSRLTDYER